MRYNVGDKVQWNWGKGTGTGKVDQIYTEKVTRKIDGSEITRNASGMNPPIISNNRMATRF